MKNSVKQDFEAIQNGTLQQKLQFFWDYYRWTVITAAVVMTIIISAVVSVVTAKDTFLSGITLNSYSASPEAPYGKLVEEFMDTRQADPADWEFEINTSLVYSAAPDKVTEENYQTIQRIGAQIAAHDLDFMTGDQGTMEALAYSGMFVDLTTVLSETQLALYQPYLHYIDWAVVESETTVTALPDSAQPESMQKPVPVFVDVSGCAYLAEGYEYLSEPLLFAIAVNAPQEARAAALMDFLMSDVMAVSKNNLGG